MVEKCSLLEDVTENGKVGSKAEQHIVYPPNLPACGVWCEGYVACVAPQFSSTGKRLLGRLRKRFNVC